MFWRAWLAFLALPGMVAFVVPLWVLVQSRAAVVHPAGSILLLAGFAGLLWCVRDFYRAGKGTLAPWQPPKNLVIVGLYRYSRNPMYVSVSLMLFGWAATHRSMTLLIYAVCVLVAFHLRIVLGEEPWLARTFGSDWEQYRSRVPRWLWQGAGRIRRGD
jgi:protein-S-isoprenylcysteine O-methyltransferase Ste14